MAKVRYITEMGMGVDVHGGDYTKAACRAVSDALRHSSLNFFKALGKSHDDMHITVKIGVAEPDQIDCTVVAEQIPYGSVTVEPCVGGMNIDGGMFRNTVMVARPGLVFLPSHRQVDIGQLEPRAILDWLHASQ